MPAILKVEAVRERGPLQSESHDSEHADWWTLITLDRINSASVGRPLRSFQTPQAFLVVK